MTAPPTGNPSNAVLATLTAVLAVADIVLAAIGSLAFTAYRQDSITAAEAAAPTLLAASAATGAVLMALTGIALIRRPRGHRLAQVTAALAWLRLVALIIAVAVIAVVLGTAAVVGLTETFLVILTFGEAFGALLFTGIANRRTGTSRQR